MPIEQLQVAKELTLAAVDKLSATSLSLNHEPKETAETIGEMFQIILEKVTQQD